MEFCYPVQLLLSFQVNRMGIAEIIQQLFLEYPDTQRPAGDGESSN